MVYKHKFPNSSYRIVFIDHFITWNKDEAYNLSKKCSLCQFMEKNKMGFFFEISGSMPKFRNYQILFKFGTVMEEDTLCKKLWSFPQLVTFNGFVYLQPACTRVHSSSGFWVGGRQWNLWSVARCQSQFIGQSDCCADKAEVFEIFQISRFPTIGEFLIANCSNFQYDHSPGIGMNSCEIVCETVCMYQENTCEIFLKIRVR